MSDELEGLSGPEYRAAIEACKERMLINFKIIREEYPHLFK